MFVWQHFFCCNNFDEYLKQVGSPDNIAGDEPLQSGLKKNEWGILEALDENEEEAVPDVTCTATFLLSESC